MTLVDALVALVIAVGLVGILLPVLPGSALVLAAILGWAIHTAQPTGWVVFAVATTFLVLGTFVKYVVPGRSLRTAGVPGRTLAAGGLLGIVGFFVVPVVGLVLGFVAGVHLAEIRRVGRDRARRSTVTALRAVGLSILIELGAALLAALTWVTGVALT